MDSGEFFSIKKIFFLDNLIKWDFIKGRGVSLREAHRIEGTTEGLN